MFEKLLKEIRTIRLKFVLKVSNSTHYSYEINKIMH